MNSVHLVLLVEDSEDDSFFFQRAVEKSTVPCKVRHVTDGHAAIEFLGQSGEADLPDIIFLDLKMPVFDGFEVLEWLRAHPEINAAPVVVLSGSNQESDKSRARELGASDYIVKPITPSSVLAWIGKLPSRGSGKFKQGSN